MKKVLVCGTGFGQYYLKAIENLGGEVELVGILSHGSERSAQWADRLSVSLYTSLEQLDKLKIDIACVVVKSEIVGGAGTEMTKYFLNRGIHVFQEHPMHYDTYAECIKLARKNHCYYVMNTFYPFLRSVNMFLKTIEGLKKDSEINYIRAECGIQVLYPMIDILGRIGGNINSLKIDRDLFDKRQIPFAIVRGTVVKIPFILLIKNEMDTQNVESNIALLHQINVNTSSGNLTLTDVHGQVVWTPVIHEDLKEGSRKRKFSEIPIQQSLINNIDFSMEDIFEKLWPASIRRSLREFIMRVDTGENMSFVYQHYLGVCKIWNEIGNMLGLYKPVSYKISVPVKLEIKPEEEF